MYLALKEIRHEKLRYSLIVAMIVMITYLIFILSGLATGLANENTQAIDSWHAKSIVLDRDANVNLSQSTITNEQVNGAQLTKSQALIGQSPVVVKQNNRKKESAQFVGLKGAQYIAKDLVISSGRKAQNNHELVADQQFKMDGYRLGNQVKFNSSSTQYTIVGFTKNAKLNVAPVVYGSLKTWQTLRNLPSGNLAGSAIVSKTAKFSGRDKGLKTYSNSYFISKLPGYSAQNTTFGFMIGFLMVISLVIIAVFLYILTIQALPMYAILRAQGIPAARLVRTILSQSLILMACGIVIGAILTAITAKLIPFGAPIFFNVPMLSAMAVGLLLMGIIGAAIPARKIATVDPVQVIGG
ncbi:ABC transporter permease [Lentilactobacillus diolivorans]|uniref:Putative hemin transport system permease protein HrtB n=2 Tax=Lentilactobacillus diolivorans TaxID=179838 RepID=A0A0R1S8T8_9LACO|nr:FtsX-like permease family protein [Lentilactobacillus diolivorans]KRL65517.1 ABC superfamily ATP binding cassette transporter, membrane protein [Lentilactobacillus diolivorans DSM 14421]GEP24175.1 peptide ABC transporter permease [Lentilactobacillus diolivorans]